MPDYSKGKIYTIRNRNDDTKIYVGSTIQSLAVRFAGHKRTSRKERCMNFKLYVEVNNNWDNWYIELYESYPCNNREELYKREGEIIREIGTLNSRIAGRDDKQFYIDNTKKIIEQQKQYYIDNADKIAEYQKQHYIKNAEKLKEQAKEYRIKNAEKIKEQRKEFRIENAEKIKEQRKDNYLKTKLKQT
jgi:hypothetical protein